MTVEIIEYASKAAQTDALTETVADALRRRIETQRQATLAAPGGTTPRDFLTALGAKSLDWSSVTVLPSDERWIPPDHERSNEAMIRAALLANGAQPQIFSLWRKGLTASQAATGLSVDIGPHLPLDVCILGMGADMHCASLFPGGDALPLAMAHGAPAIVGISAPGADEPRVTLSADALAGGALHLLITGEEKMTALKAALDEEDPLIAPVGAVLRRTTRACVHWAP